MHCKARYMPVWQLVPQIHPSVKFANSTQLFLMNYNLDTKLLFLDSTHQVLRFTNVHMCR